MCSREHCGRGPSLCWAYGILYVCGPPYRPRGQTEFTGTVLGTFWTFRLLKWKPLRRVNYLLQLILGVAQSAVVAFIFSALYSAKNSFWLLCLPVNLKKGLKSWILNGTVSVGRFVMVCMYMHTVLRNCSVNASKASKIVQDYTCLSSYYLKQQLLCSIFVRPDVNLFVIALNSTLISQGQGREKRHIVQGSTGFLDLSSRLNDRNDTTCFHKLQPSV